MAGGDLRFRVLNMVVVPGSNVETYFTHFVESKNRKNERGSNSHITTPWGDLTDEEQTMLLEMVTRREDEIKNHKDHPDLKDAIVE